MKLIKNDVEEIIVQDSDWITKSVTDLVVKKAKLIDDFFYSNLETSILKAMKHRIESELFNRSLKEYSENNFR